MATTHPLRGDANELADSLLDYFDIDRSVDAREASWFRALKSGHAVDDGPHKETLDNPLSPERLDLSGVVSEFRSQHFIGVLAEQRRGAILLHRGLGEGDGIADQGQV